MDGRVLAFTAIACLLTGIAFGLAPALSALRIDLNSSLKESGAASQITDRLHLRSLFVVAEVALAMVLLVGGSLLAKTLWRLQHVDTGFRAENILTFRFTVPAGKFTRPRKKAICMNALRSGWPRCREWNLWAQRMICLLPARAVDRPLILKAARLTRSCCFMPVIAP